MCRYESFVFRQFRALKFLNQMIFDSLMFLEDTSRAGIYFCLSPISLNLVFCSFFPQKIFEEAI